MDKYQAAYQDMIRHTSTKDAPWHVVPADHKWFARVVIGSVITSTLDASTCVSPASTRPNWKEFAKVRKALESEAKRGKRKTRKSAKR